MKYLLTIACILVGFVSKAQLPSNTIPTQFSTGLFKQGWHISDSGSVDVVRDTFYARYPGTRIVRIQGGDTASWFYGGNRRWFRGLQAPDTLSLSNRINLKLNITDTTGKWWSINKRWADTLYRVNDSTVGYTINGTPYTFQILGRISGGGGGGSGTVTSVALSMPSAFSVLGSPITNNGTFSVSGAGTTAQYIRGNGTLATTDTGMIPNFYLKIRGLLSGTSPITFNQTTGIIGVLRANNTGQLGAATFNNSDFTDNGAGLISLRNPAGTPGVDTIYRTEGIDSVYYTINGTTYAIKDSVGTGGGGGITALTGEVTASGTGSVVATIANNVVTYAKMQQVAGLSVIGNATSSTADAAAITAGSDSTVLRRIGNTLNFGKVDSNMIANTGVTPGSYTLANITVGPDGRIKLASNGSVSGIPTLDAVLIAGGTAFDNDMFLIRNSGGQQVLQVQNNDTTSDNDVTRANIVSQRGKAVLCLVAPDSTDAEVQHFKRDRVPGTWQLTDSVAIKTWVYGVVGKRPSNPTSLWRGFRFVNVENSMSVINATYDGLVGLRGVTDPKAWLDLPSGGGFAGLRIEPEVGGIPDSSAGDIHNVGNQLTYTDFTGGIHNIIDQISNAGDGSFSGSGPYTFNPSFTFSADQFSGIGRVGSIGTPIISSNSASSSSVAFFNSNASGYAGFDLFDYNFVRRGFIRVANAATTRVRVVANTGSSLDFEAGGENDNNPNVRITSGGDLLVATTTDNGEKFQVNGTSRLNGLLNYRGVTAPPSTYNILVHGLTDSIVYQVPLSAIGGGITTLNTLTASTQTFATGTSGSDFNISSSSSTHTFNIPSASTSNRGFVTIGTQTFGGIKTFNDGLVSTNSIVGGRVVISGNMASSSAPGISGVGLLAATMTYTDNGASRTVSGSDNNFNVIKVPTITSGNAVIYADNTINLKIDGAPASSGSMTLSHPWAVYANSASSFQTIAFGLNELNTSGTLGDGSNCIYTGSGGDTFTLPALATHPGKMYFVKNAGGGNLTVQRGGSDNIYNTASVTSITVSAGSAVILVAGSSFWYVE